MIKINSKKLIFFNPLTICKLGINFLNLIIVFLFSLLKHKQKNIYLAKND